MRRVAARLVREARELVGAVGRGRPAPGPPEFGSSTRERARARGRAQAEEGRASMKALAAVLASLWPLAAWPARTAGTRSSTTATGRRGTT
jgi:hypothetical protein